MVDRRSPETTSPSDIESTGGRRASGQGSPVPIREQDRLLPIANVGRIMRQTLPANAKISKEAKETMQECVSEFISFVTAEASDKCRKEKRKTINGDDILAAMTALGFEPYADSLRIYLVRYRELEGDRSSGVLQQQQAKQGLHRSPPSRTNGEYFEDPAVALQRAVYGQIPRGPIAYGENRPLVLGGQNFDSAGGRGR